MHDILTDPDLAEDMVWAPRKIYDGDGNCVYTELWTGDWWWTMQSLLHPRERMPTGGSCTIIPIILSSDKVLHGAQSGNSTSWPLYLTVGNIPSKKRWLLTKPYARLIGLLPDIKGIIFERYFLTKTDADTGKGLEARHALFHNTLSRILEPLYQVMDNGISIKCGDGVQRRCYPRLAQYLADYEEQHLLAGILSGSCPTCLIPFFRKSRADAPYLNPNTFPPREGDHAYDSRTRFSDDLKSLRNLGYHSIIPFSEHYHHMEFNRFCSIYDALSPDLLHQLSKNFWDYIYAINIKALLKLGTSEKKIAAEIDAHLSHVPMYQDLKWFRHGCSKIKRWTGKEYKNMLRIFLCIIRDIVPDDVVKFTRAFMDIHRMSHYESYTSNEGRETAIPGTVELLEQAIDDFRQCLIQPDNFLIKSEILQLGWYTPKMHYAHHYAECIRQKGTLPQCSTDRSEALH